ncbi:MAG: hypothetical protein M0P09_00900 [Acholeplasmataceae bacterium]|nr:hypothetical protein [Acholeplasmataceae bacterium]
MAGFERYHAPHPVIISHVQKWIMKFDDWNPDDCLYTFIENIIDEGDQK